MDGSGDHVRRNRKAWNAKSDEYQAEQGAQLDAAPMAWGVWSVPESDLRVLGDVAGRDVLELGCGGAQWTAALAQAGARVVGMDLSERQLGHAAQRLARTGARATLVHANAESLPFAAGSFDIVFCDHGATSFSDPDRTIPEAARVLRRGGRLAFSVTSPLLFLCWTDDGGPSTTLQGSYFDLRVIEDEDEVDFQRPYGEWIRLFRRCGLVVEDLIELRPPDELATSAFAWDARWAHRWPAENLWVLSR